MTPMDAKTLEALKWERNAEAKTPASFVINAGSCPLCELFNTEAGCDGCPVSYRTGADYCALTPYVPAKNAKYEWLDEVDGSADRAHAAARDEVAFLKSLLPEETP